MKGSRHSSLQKGLSQGQNLALTVSHVPDALDGGLPNPSETRVLPPAGLALETCCQRNVAYTGGDGTHLTQCIS